MVKYVTAVRLCTAETGSILRRFVRSNIQHPTYNVFSELGRVVKIVQDALTHLLGTFAKASLEWRIYCDDKRGKLFRWRLSKKAMKLLPYKTTHDRDIHRDDGVMWRRRNINIDRHFDF